MLMIDYFETTSDNFIVIIFFIKSSLLFPLCLYKMSDNIMNIS